MFFKDIKFNRQELSGSMGDIGTDFPLIVAMISVAGLHTPSVLIVFGVLQIFTGLVYRIPMPVQPLKAMATLVIAQKIGGNILLGAGLAIGGVMFILTATGILDKLSRLIPKTVIRGIQLGLGISLCSIAFKEYIPKEGLVGYGLAFFAFALIISLIDYKKYPTSLLVILLGILYALVFKIDFTVATSGIGFHLPQFNTITFEDISTGFVMLALPQIPLSLGNSIMSTKQIANDLYPNRQDITIQKIGYTYSLMNIIAPLGGGIPCCHGSGGMVGHYTFGGRTGGSVILYGLFYILLGVFCGDMFQTIVQVFPFPILGVILIFEGIALMLLIKDIVNDGKEFMLAILVGMIAFGLPFGFAIAMLVGTLLYYLPLKFKTFNQIGTKTP